VAPLIHYLTDAKQWERGVRLVGDASINLMRAPTISFVVVGDRAIKSRAIVEIFDEKGGVSDQMKWILPAIPDPHVITRLAFDTDISMPTHLSMNCPRS